MGSTALAANCEDSILSISFLTDVPFTLRREAGRPRAACDSRASGISRSQNGSELGMIGVMNVISILAMETG